MQEVFLTQRRGDAEDVFGLTVYVIEWVIESRQDAMFLIYDVSVLKNMKHKNHTTYQENLASWCRGVR